MDETAAPEAAATGANRRALVVDDHALFAEALARVLATQGFACQVAGLLDVEGEIHAFRPHLVLLDVNLGGVDGLELVPPAVRAGAKVVIVTGTRDDDRLAVAAALGASGWVDKSSALPELVEVATAVLAGRPLWDAARHADLVERGRRELARQADLRWRFDGLTSREWEVLERLDLGHSVPAIGAELHISVPTVRSHIRGILAKLDVPSQLAAVALYNERRRLG